MEGSGSLKKYKILVVGHNPTDEKILSDILSPFYEVVISNAEDTIIEQLQDKEDVISAAIFNFDVALDCLKAIRMIPVLEDFPILVSTLHGSAQIENELLEYGVVDFLKQPYDARRVINRVKTCIKLFNANKIIFELERDELTGLFTRKAFLRRAEKVRAENPKKKFAILAFDFDNFKSSNTLYGEAKCNEFLAYTAKRLKGLIPHSIVGRYGGDQYILFFAFDGDNVDVNRIQYLTKSILETAPIPHQIVKCGINSPISHDLPFVICCDRAFLAIQQIKGIYGKDIAFFEADLITGLIKANIPSRIAFMVAQRIDSQIIIDGVGAEKLLGRGDMLYASAVDPAPIRIQGTYLDDNEVEKVVEYVKQYGEPEYIDDQIFVEDGEDEEGNVDLFGNNMDEDPLYDQALEIVVQSGKASASYIQRRLKIGYNRAARLVEEMEERGIVGPANGSKPREIIHIPN